MNKQDKLMKFGLIVLCIVVALILIRDGLAFGGRNDNVTTLPSITVTGQADAKAVPDVSRFTFEIRKEGKTIDEAQNAVSAVLNPLVEAYKDADIDEKDIRTTGFNSYPLYDYVQASIGLPGKQVLRGYESVVSVEVTVRDTSKAGAMVTLAAERGATGISQLMFVVDDESKVQAEARQQAIADAREKAEQLADDLDVRLGKVLAFSESGGGMPPMPFYGRDMAVQNSAGSAAPELPTGQNEYTVTVSVTYEIR